VFAFLTTLPNALTATINHERSPVLLTGEEQFGTWLTGSAEEAFALLRPFDPERMHIVQSRFEKEFGGGGVGREVSSVGERARPPDGRDTRQTDLFDEF
jgi:hypothetical protein